MLDLPELLAPARTVRGRISICCSLSIDLKPETLIPVMPEIAGFFIFVFRAKACAYGFAQSAYVKSTSNRVSRNSVYYR